jgi:hypothetical protein
MRANVQIPKPLALTDRQLRLIQTAARAVPVERRDLFLQNVAEHLTSERTDSAVSPDWGARRVPIADIRRCCDDGCFYTKLPRYSHSK